MHPNSKSASLLESCSSFPCHDSCKAGCEASLVGSAEEVASTERVSTTSGEGDNGNGGAKDNESHYHGELKTRDVLLALLKNCITCSTNIKKKILFPGL